MGGVYQADLHSSVDRILNKEIVITAGQIGVCIKATEAFPC